MSCIRAHVECYAGFRGEETPRSFRLGRGRVDVLEVVDRWLDPEHRYFKVRGSDGATWILRHDVARDAWELTVYERPAADVTRNP